MHSDEEASFNELGALMKKIRAVESIARHHEDAVKFHKRAGQNAEQQAEKARTEAKTLRELYKGSIKKFATAFNVELPAHGSSVAPTLHGKNHEKRATVESVLDWPFSGVAISPAKVQAIAATDTDLGSENEPKRTDQHLPSPNPVDKSEVRTLHILHTNAAYTLDSDHQNTSSEYTSMSSSFVQRVAKRKESISALQKMNPFHQRTASEPVRKVSSRVARVEDTPDEEDLASEHLGLEHDHMKAFL